VAAEPAIGAGASTTARKIGLASATASRRRLAFINPTIAMP